MDVSGIDGLMPMIRLIAGGGTISGIGVIAYFITRHITVERNKRDIHYNKKEIKVLDDRCDKVDVALGELRTTQKSMDGKLDQLIGLHLRSNNR